MTLKIQEWLDAIDSRRRKDGAEARREAKSFSIHLFQNPWRKAPCGDTKGRGYFTLCWSEVIHQLEGGIMKKSCGLICDMLWSTGKSGYMQNKANGYSSAWLLPVDTIATFLTTTP
jgi:hypothetical protein